MCSPAEYLEAKAKAEEGSGFLLTEEVVEAIDKPRGRTISTGGRFGGDCMGGGDVGRSDSFEAEGVSGRGRGRERGRGTGVEGLMLEGGSGVSGVSGVCGICGSIGVGSDACVDCAKVNPAAAADAMIPLDGGKREIRPRVVELYVHQHVTA